MSSKYTMDMCNGPLLKKIILFAIPLMLSGVLQLLFNAADVIVVGRFTGKKLWQLLVQQVRLLIIDQFICGCVCRC